MEMSLVWLLENAKTIYFRRQTFITLRWERRVMQLQPSDVGSAPSFPARDFSAPRERLELIALEHPGPGQQILTDAQGNLYQMCIPPSYASGDTLLFTVVSERTLQFPQSLGPGGRCEGMRGLPSELRGYVPGDDRLQIVQKNPLGLLGYTH